MIKVIKRDGREVAFDKKKIEKAVEKAMKSTGLVDMELAVRISDEIERSVKKESISIDEIQSQVEKKLMSSKRKDVAQAYIEYRHWRSQQREAGTLGEFISDVVDLNNLENENANMPEWVFTAKKERIVSEVLENHANRYLLTPDVKKAWEDNIVYIHDFNSYAVGMHNCALIDLGDILERGFITQNGDVRPPRSIRSAMQLTAVILQCASNEQFGGISVANLDYDLAPYVAISFEKIYTRFLELMTDHNIDDVMSRFGKVQMSNSNLKNTGDKSLDRVFEESLAEIYKVTLQSAEGLIHNLNTLQSRSGNQLPFTSINYGTDTSEEGRLVSRCVLEARMSGVGKNGITPIFPIGIFKHKKGVNAKEGDPNYDLKKLAIESTSKRIYPNFANVDAPHLMPATDKDTEFATIN